MNNIIFKYSIKLKNKPVKEVEVNYYKLLNILGYNNKKDRFGIPYNKANSPQILDILNILNSLDEVNNCNVFLNEQIIF
jgi:hypothetical protein|tara:strand:+ start:61 stop:297 length:237 start_codon:yes stop_codon:yes gene_type:complete